MAAPIKDIVPDVHHEQLPLCETRPAYRQGRKLTAVKVYTISDESKHLLIVGVPAIGLQSEVKQLCSRYGDVLSVVLAPNYADDQFSEVFHVHYSRLQSSRFAKRQLDGKEFYGGLLHVCYIPEMESVAETRQKLIQRRREVALRCSKDMQNEKSKEKYIRQYQRKTIRIGDDGKKGKPLNVAAVKCFWKGKPLREDPRSAFKSSNTKQIYGPQLPGSEWKAAGLLERYLLPNQSRDSSTKQTKHSSSSFEVPSSSLQGPSEATNTSFKPAVLRLIPRQIKGLQRTVVPVKVNEFKEELPDMSDKSLDATVQAVRNRIREVSVPNIKIYLSGRSERGSEK